MTEFNHMTIVAAAQLIEKMHTQAEFTLLATEWAVANLCGSGSVLAKVSAVAQIAIDESPKVYTVSGLMPLGRAMVELALTAHPNRRDSPEWTKLLAGLRLDGFEACEETSELARNDFWGNPLTESRLVLRRMLPSDLPETDFREAQSELVSLLNQFKFATARGHLEQSITAFSRGDWAASNAQMRSCFEDVMHRIAERVDAEPTLKMDACFKSLGELSPSFLYGAYNEWHLQNQKPQFLAGLWARLHPEGSHPGLSEEDDCAFRMQIVSITLRLLMRRLNQRVS